MFSTIKGNAAAYYMQIECTELLCRAQDVIPYSPGPYRGGGEYYRRNFRENPTLSPLNVFLFLGSLGERREEEQMYLLYSCPVCVCQG